MSKKLNLSIIWKALVIGVLILIMLIPLAFVRGNITGRLDYKDNAKAKVTDSWGGPIAIAAPILNIPYTVESVDENKKKSYSTAYAKFAPKNVDIKVNLLSQSRYIGIFEVPVFTAEITMAGSFDKLPAGDMEDAMQLKNAFVTLEINDLKGISTPDFVWRGKNLEFAPAVYGNPLSLSIPRSYGYDTDSSFVVTKYDRYDNYGSNSNVLKSLSSRVEFNNDSSQFEIKFKIKGSDSISFAPIAKENNFAISSTWANPSFSGAFLPDTKTINSEGFNAKWNISYLASGIPTRLNGADLSSAIFKTALLVPVDNYRAAERATKYGILFIILTFLSFFVFEITSKKPVHPFQYLLAGLAMAIFYMLLLSISEFIPFGWAYLIAAAAVVIMLTVYLKFAVLKSMSVKNMLLVAAAFSALYGYLYILLQLQDMALIFGSISLFVALAIVMYATRNISWYEEQ
ncbi:MAG: cell envelope integrity protein CreD [Endomicrobia bacterium]|nr:cell envelope integrity protein CreD [Endomicrobiia bacterium]